MKPLRSPTEGVVSIAEGAPLTSGKGATPFFSPREVKIVYPATSVARDLFSRASGNNDSVVIYVGRHAPIEAVPGELPTADSL
jgi:hypothetical protein